MGRKILTSTDITAENIENINKIPSIEEEASNANEIAEEALKKIEELEFEAEAGADGKSAYEVALDNGFKGTEQEWLASLKGTNGADGKNGSDGKTPYIQNGYWYIDGVNTNVKAEGSDGKDGTNGSDGKDYVLTETDKSEIANITKELIPLTDYAKASDVKEAKDIASRAEAKFDVANSNATTAQQTADDARARAMAAKAQAENAESIAKGRATGYVFDTKADMDTWLTVQDNVSKLVQGDNLYIRAVDVPDYWWDGAGVYPLETQKVNLSGYTTKEYVDGEIELTKNALTSLAESALELGSMAYDYADNTHGKTVELEERVNNIPFDSYAKKSELPTKVSELTNDSKFLTSIPSEYVTETELNDKGYLTEHQDLSAYAKTSQIPTKVSQLTNDSKFLTSVPSGYAKTADHYTKSESDNKYQPKGSAETWTFTLSDGTTTTKKVVLA